MSPDQRDELLMRYFDGRATAAEMQSLNALLKEDAGARDVLAEICFQAVAMADLARERAMVPCARKADLARQGPVGRRRWWAIAATACAAILVLAVFAWWPSWPGPVLLADFSGPVTWVDPAGQSHHDLKPGDELHGGTVQVQGTASFANLLFRDGSTVTLAGESEVTVVARSQKMLLVRNGDLRAEVRPQRAGRPMLLRTPTAEVEVLGTRFSMGVDPQETRLTVAKGRVQMRRLADGSTTEVPEQASAVATLRTTDALKAQHRLPPPARWRQTFERPPGKTWKGEWKSADRTGPGRLQAIPEVYDRSKYGGPGVAYVVSALDGCHHIALVDPDSVLSVRWRTAKPANLMILVGLHSPECDFRGNFQADLVPDQVRPDATGWCQVKFPLSGLKAGVREHPRPLPGSRVFLVLVASHMPEPGLEVSELSIEPPPPPRAH